MTKQSQELIRHYRHIERRFQVTDCTSTYASLVTANGNQNFPVQRWFHLKEAFSLELLQALLNDWGIPVESISRLLDPFSGVATSLLAMQKLAKKHNRGDLEAVGFERNPFLHFVGQTKLRWHEYDVKEVKSRAAYLLDGAVKNAPKILPSLSTLHREEVYDVEVLRDILGFREAIRGLPCDNRVQDFLLLGYASTLEAASGVRKDGRALRIVPNKQRPAVSKVLREAWARMARDLSSAQRYFVPTETQILQGDGRNLTVDGDTSYAIGHFDLIFYSPPYLNNIDYTEVYKIELWLSGLVNTAEEFRSLRYKTFRSHPSVRFPDPITIDRDERMGEVLSALDILIGTLPTDKDLTWRSAVFKGYFDDMYVSLKHQIDVLVPGGWIFCVVGNSLHGPTHKTRPRVPVASDLLVALIAQCLGLEVKAIQVARYLRRRSPSGKYLRESIVVMQKPFGMRKQ